MGKLLILLAFISLVSSCKKEVEELNQSVEVETGIYVGKLNNFRTGQTLTQFKVSLTKTGDKMYKITQIDSGNMPEIILEDKLHSYPFAMFRISNQTYQGTTFAGAGQVSGGYDGLFNVSTKALHLNIQFSDNTYLYYDGNRQ